MRPQGPELCQYWSIFRGCFVFMVGCSPSFTSSRCELKIEVKLNGQMTIDFFMIRNAQSEMKVHPNLRNKSAIQKWKPCIFCYLGSSNPIW